MPDDSGHSCKALPPGPNGTRNSIPARMPVCTCPAFLCSSIELTTGITWQSGQRYFLHVGTLFFWMCLCLLLFFLSFLCRCSPCITTSRSYWLTEGLLGYQQSQNPSPSLEAVSEVFKIFVSLLLALYEHDCSFIWGFVWSRSVFSSGELTCPPAQFVKPRLV